MAGRARQAGSLTRLKEQLDRARAELDHAKREGNLAKAGGELSYGIILGWRSSSPMPRHVRI